MKDDRILLAHGSGGKLSAALTERVFLPHFDDPALRLLDDQAVLDIPAGRLAVSTDTYTVSPIFFPGGDIGSLAIHGTVNDVAMCGADPVAMSVGFILEEGFPVADLERIARSMADAARGAGVRIVTADTKVVSRGSADGIFVNTTGIGILPRQVRVSGHGARPGDAVLLSGTVGDHGIAIASARDGIRMATTVPSDSAPLNGMVRGLLRATGDRVSAMRDPTRGGLATVLNEIAFQSRVGIEVREEAIPVREAVRGACELLGYDPLYLANEGKMIAMVPGDLAAQALLAMRSDPHGADACLIGEVVADHPGKVVMETLLGGRRLLDRLTGDMLPRIC